jgi:putative DNA primase/helicase
MRDDAAGSDVELTDEDLDDVLDSSQPEDARPCFRLRPELTEMTDEAIAALARRPDLGVYVRSRVLVTVAGDGRPRETWRVRPDGALSIIPMSEARILAAIDRAATFEKWSGREKSYVRTTPPGWLAVQVRERTEWALPYLEGIVSVPTLRPDGSVLNQPGYDEASGLLFVPPSDMSTWPGVPEQPTEAEKAAARETLLEPVVNFPFVAGSDRAAYVAAVLTLAVRHHVTGPVPLFAIRAPAPGTGKGLLVSVIGAIGTGRAPDIMTFTDSDELRKRVTTMVIDGTPAVVLDNISGALGSDVLAAILTRASWEDRLLGMNERVSLPLRLVWFATGNNLAFKRTLARRVVPIDLDAHAERPEDRSDFKYPDLLAHVQRERLRYVAAALTLMRAFYVAGCPRHSAGARMGSFEAWDDLIRSAVIWIGAGDPAPAEDADAGRGRVRATADDDLDSLAALLAELERVYPERAAFTAPELVVRAESDAALRTALLGVAQGRDGKVSAKGLGYVLRDCARRPVDGRQLSDAGHRKRPRRYFVTAFTSAPGDDGDDGDDTYRFAGGRRDEHQNNGGGNNRPDRPIVPDKYELEEREALRSGF